MTHAPGPWWIAAETIIMSDRGKIAEMCWLTNYFEANARLISAAPDMLAVLKETVRCGSLPDSWADPIRAAIAKAEGRHE